MKKSSEVEFFDGFVIAHGDYDVLGEGAYRRLLGLFDTLVKPKAGEQCFDLGCGTGAFTSRLAKFGLALTGVDISPQSIQMAQAKASGEKYVVGDITCLPFPDASIDIAVFSGVLHHCPRESLRIGILREAFRLLRPGGRLFAYDPSGHSPSMWLYRHPKSPLYSSVGKTENEVLLTPKEILHELSVAGFEQAAARGAGGITYRYVEGRLARMFLPLYNVYEWCLMWSGLEGRLGTFLISFAVKPL